MPCLSLRSAVLVALLFGAPAAPSFAASVQHNGAEQTATQLSTYGMQVDAEHALRSSLPDGWQLTVASGTELTGKVSWGPKDTWLDVLKRVSERSDVDVTVDWRAQTILVEAPVSPSENHATAEEAAADKAKVPAENASAPVHQEAPSAIPAAKSTNKVPEAPTLVEEKSFASAAGPARAFNRTLLRVPFEALAEYHGLDLIYEAGDVTLPGALTLLFDQGLETDIELLDRAFGRHLPLEIILYEKERQLIVREAPRFTFASFDARPVPPVKRSLFARLFRSVPKAQTTEAESQAALAVLAEVEAAPVTPISEPKVEIDPTLVAASPTSTQEANFVAVETSEGHLVLTASSAEAASTKHVEAAPSPPAAVPPLAVPAPTPVTLELAQGELLSSAIERLLETHGWSLVWRANIDLEAATPTRVVGASFTEILEQVLPQLGLSADLYNPSRTIVIRTSQDSASQGAP